MYITVNAEIDTDEVLSEVGDKYLVDELESRGYIVNNENDTINVIGISNNPIDIIKNVKNVLGLKSYHNLDDIIKELNDLKLFI